MKKPKRYWEVLAVGKKIYSTDRDKPRLWRLFMVAALMVAVLLLTTSFMLQSDVRGQREVLARQRAKAKAKLAREFEMEFRDGLKAFRVANDLEMLIGAITDSKQGVAPKTEEEAAAPSVTFMTEGGAAETIEYTMDELQQRKWSYVMDQLEKMKAGERRAVRVQVIDAYLANSPMRGLGATIVANAERTGVNAYMCPVQAEAESSKGVVLCGSCNPFGMLGMSFGSFDQAVAAYFDNIVRHWGVVQRVSQLVNPEYCEPMSPYGENCDAVIEALEAQENSLCFTSVCGGP